jgi:hypothetical protein
MLFIVFLLLIASPIVSVVLFARRKSKAGGIALAVFAGLFCLLFVEAQLQNRSTPGHVFRWLKGENRIHQNMNDLAEDAKKTVDAAELQRWAMKIMQETPPTNTPPEITADKVPADIQSLVSDGVQLGDAECDSTSDSVWLYWGGPFGHWGIRVGSPTFTVNSKTGDYADYAEWKPGIYFWCETR